MHPVLRTGSQESWTSRKPALRSDMARIGKELRQHPRVFFRVFDTGQMPHAPHQMELRTGDQVDRFAH